MQPQTRSGRGGYGGNGGSSGRGGIGRDSSRGPAYETRTVANQINTKMSELFPVSWEALTKENTDD